MLLQKRPVALFIRGMILMIVFSCSTAYSQTFTSEYSAEFLKKHYNAIGFDETFYSEDLPSSKVFFMRSPNPYFNQSFLIHESGSTLSTSFTTSQYFRPNYNPLVFGAGTAQQDSFNPYGATDMGSALVSGSINKLIGVFSKGKGLNWFR